MEEAGVLEPGTSVKNTISQPSALLSPASCPHPPPTLQPCAQREILSRLPAPNCPHLHNWQYVVIYLDKVCFPSTPISIGVRCHEYSWMSEHALGGILQVVKPQKTTQPGFNVNDKLSWFLIIFTVLADICSKQVLEVILRAMSRPFPGHGL